MTEKSKTLDALPSVIPVFPLPGVILLPGASLPLNVFEPRYLKMVRDTATGHNLIGMIQPREKAREKEGSSKAPPLFTVGGVGSISEFHETEDGRILIRLKGLSRFRIEEELAVTTPYRQVRADWKAFQQDPWGGSNETSVERDALMASLKTYLDIKGLDADFSAIAGAPDDVLVNTLSMIVPFSPAEKQALLEAPEVWERSELLKKLLIMAASNLAANDSDGSAH